MDPMCGSGLVVRRALDSGHIAIGLDIDPLAVLMAKVWTSRISQAINPSLGTRLVDKAQDLLGTPIELPWIDCDPATSEYIDFWFAAEQQEQIRALVVASGYLKGMRRDLVHLALSRIIVTKSKGASLAADTSHSRPHRVRTENDFDALAGFKKSFERLIQLLRNHPVQEYGKIRHGDARTLRGIKGESVDAIITSPPYINAIDYLRGHRLALVWMGYSIKDIRGIRTLGVGAPHRHAKSVSKRADVILQAATNETLPKNVEPTVRRYILDMMACLKQTHRVLRPGGYAVYVVGNSTLKGIEIDTAKVITEIARKTGLCLENKYTRDIPREHRYLPPPQMTKNPQLAGRMKTESVLRFQKSADASLR